MILKGLINFLSNIFMLSNPVPWERNFFRGGGGAAHCISSYSANCYKGNIPQFENYWGGGGAPAVYHISIK